jgi:TrmH family RNA methyltransferase
MELISSRNNPKIKQLRLLKARKGRQASGLVLVEGIHPVGEAAAASLENDTAIEAIVYAPQLLQSVFANVLVEQQAARGIPCLAVTREVFQSIAEKDNPQGLLAAVKPAEYELEELSPQSAPWCVALVSPQDPGNVGTILRSIDAAGASALLLLEESVDAFHPNAVRASMGACFWTPTVNAAFEEFSVWANLIGYRIYGTSAHANQDYNRVEYRQPCILLMGSEREGLSPAQRAVCHDFVRIPMSGRATSLNVSVAAGVLLYAMRDYFR